MTRSLAALCLATLGLVAPGASAGDPRALQAELELGPVIGGQDLIASIRSTEANALGVVFLSFDGTPTILGNKWPAFSLGLGSADLLTIFTDAQGQLYYTQATTPGEFGAAGLGLTFYLQAVLLSQTGQRLATNREAVEVEPLSPGNNWFTDVSAARLPVGFDAIEGFLASSGDFNRDGVPDLALTGLDDNTQIEFLALWINDGAGNFSDETATRIPGFLQGSSVGFVEALDADQDNRMDILVTGGDDGTDVPDTLWVDDGTGTFVEDTAFAGGSFSTFGVEPGDFDNDGRMDLVRIQGEASVNPGVFPTDALTLNTAGGWVDDAGFGGALWNDPFVDVVEYVAGDIDDDGDLDLFVALFGLANQVIRNDGVGLGGFVDASLTNIQDSTGAFGAKLDDSLGATMADLDLDGDLDAVVLNSYFSFVQADSGDLYFNDGSGLLVEDNTSDVETVLFDDGFRITVDVGDLDADGDPDIYFGGHDLFAGTNQVILLNQGGVQAGSLGDFTRVNWFDPPPFITSDVELFDMDADGDLEILQVAAGVVSGNGADGVKVHLFENGTL
jgi:hypothetical protein